MADHQHLCRIVQQKVMNEYCVRAQQRFKLHRSAVANEEPKHFWWGLPQDTQVSKIRVLGDNAGILPGRIVPDLLISGASKSKFRNMLRLRKDVCQAFDKSKRQVMVIHQPHAAIST